MNEKTNEISMISVGDIIPNPHNPRSDVGGWRRVRESGVLTMKDALGKPAHELAMRTDSQAYSRTNDPAESVQAAETVDVNRGQRIVLKALYEAFTHAGEDGERGVTDGQVYDYLSRVGLILSPSGARTRRHELCEAGLAFKAGVHRRNAYARINRGDWYNNEQ